ncbi:MAG: hypothetical protein HKO85_08125 [Xanthomonadales bacterium]|nr:hypothetical protein [Gammaproteobacteria bacterium]NNJ80181.1 hypothetical protein [Xanthomonadales bacterium]NNL05244.1 hypothetical protein [Xanthomonadales bacterium]
MELAAEAARIIATEGQHNYHLAKKKAAERIGVSERLALPSNLEVKEALKRYQQLYGGPAHEETVHRMRSVAANAMSRLGEFQPRLVGAVLDGTADEHSRIALHVFAESPESVVLFFIERNIDFRQEQRQIRWFDGEHRTIPLVVSEFDDQEVELSVFEQINLRQAPPSPIDGKPQARATLNEVEELLIGRQTSSEIRF